MKYMLFSLIGWVVVLIVVYCMTHKRERICDSCKNLERKGGGIWKYECWRCGVFDRTPEYCKYYERRGDKEKHDGT